MAWIDHHFGRRTNAWDLLNKPLLETPTVGEIIAEFPEERDYCSLDDRGVVNDYLLGWANNLWRSIRDVVEGEKGYKDQYPTFIHVSANMEQWLEFDPAKYYLASFEEQQQFYQTDAWQYLRRMVYWLDQYKCRACGRTDERLHAHHLGPIQHIESVTFFRNLDPCFIRTLCESCHTTLHKEVTSHGDWIHFHPKNGATSSVNGYI